MLPSPDQSLLGASTLVFDGATLAGLSLVAAQYQSFVLRRKPIGEPFTGRANVNILLSHIAEVLFAEASVRLDARGHRFWQRYRNCGLVTGEDSGALIEQADTVVFVLSPGAVASHEALKEVEYAASLNKRFAPIVCRRVNDAAIPELLRRLNFVFFDDAAQFETCAVPECRWW